MIVLHFALTPLAGSPIRIVEALNRHTPVTARLVVLNPEAYGRRTFANDLLWDAHRDEACTWLERADVIHLHHYMDLAANPFGIDFSAHLERGCRLVRQFHTNPLTLAGGDAAHARRIVDDPLPQLVLAQFQERFYPRARIVPNVIPDQDARYGLDPGAAASEQATIFFAAANRTAARARRWDTKGFPETLELLRRVAAKHPGAVLDVPHDLPHDECLARRRRSQITVDEIVTGSFHLASLEGLAQGVPTFAYLDARTLRVVAELTGTSEHPWMNFHLDHAEAAMDALLHDPDLRRDIGRFSHDWIRRYWSEREMVQHYVTAYTDLLEDPRRFAAPRFDTAHRAVAWFVRDAHDLVWKARETRRAERTRPDAYEFTASIIVRPGDDVEHAPRYLASLGAAAAGSRHELVVVDDGRAEGSAAWKAILAVENVRIVRGDRHPGRAAAWNRGASGARGRYLVFVTDAVLPEPGWLDALVDEAEGHPEVAVVGSKLAGVDGAVRHAGIVFSREEGLPYSLYPGAPADLDLVNRRRELQAVQAGALLVRRAVFEAVDGFDTGYRGAGADIDLCLRVRRAGWRVVYQPLSALRSLGAPEESVEGDDEVRLRERWGSSILGDEDVVLTADGCARRTWQENGRERSVIEPIDAADERARWERVALVQAHVRSGALPQAVALLARPADLPADIAVQRWAGTLLAICDSAVRAPGSAG
jgi:hypothetical protein